MEGNEVVVSGERSSGSGFLLYIIGALIGGIALLVVIFRIRARAEPTGFSVGDTSTGDDLLQSQIAPSTDEEVSSDKLVPMRVVKDRGRGARTARG
ncbi:MAG: hypothetical protein IT290_02730 [Deltaproteobacteria bacterium]|nr:hypothetical protein [Deltaproteobacteria bacterium]